MFIATVVASKFREELAHYLEMVKQNKALQIIHRGSPIRVMITQEHYLDLLSRLAIYESNAQKTVAAPSIKELEARVLKKLTDTEEKDTIHVKNTVGRKRTKPA